MLNDSQVPNIEVATARLESCRDRVTAAQEAVELAAGNRSHSAGHLRTLRSTLDEYRRGLQNALSHAVDATGSDAMGPVALAVSECRTRIELATLAVEKVKSDLGRDDIACAEAAVALARAQCDLADADVLVQQATKNEAFVAFFKAVDGDVGCVGLGGKVRRAITESINASQRLADRKSELASLKELQHVTV